MEKLLIKSNGQWELVKANPVKPGIYGDIYGLDLTKPETQYSGPDLKRMQDAAITANSPQNVRHMPNLETGVMEPHVLLHYGVSNYDPDHSGLRPRPGSSKAPVNQFAVKDGNVHLNSANGAVMSNHAGYSSGFASTDWTVKPNDRLFSAWVPKSKIHADWQHTEGPESGYHRLLPAQQAQDHPHGIVTADTPDPFGSLSEYKDTGHTHVMPGVYRPAALKDLGEHASDTLIQQQHRQTFPHLYPTPKSKL